MRFLRLKTAAAVICACAGLQANAATTYLLTVTNGSKMPLSPGTVYVKQGQDSLASIGKAATAGLIQLCQMGNPALRVQELNADASVKSAVATTGHIMPNDSATFEISVEDPKSQSIQFETMYGKTKDACATIGGNSHGLYALKHHVTTALTGKDQTIVTGAFTDPALPAGRNYLDASLCSMSPDAVSCLRELSQAAAGMARVRAFAPYLASVTMLLENKYGAPETLKLIFPDSGAVHYELKLKH